MKIAFLYGLKPHGRTSGQGDNANSPVSGLYFGGRGTIRHARDIGRRASESSFAQKCPLSGETSGTQVEKR